MSTEMILQAGLTLYHMESFVTGKPPERSGRLPSRFCELKTISLFRASRYGLDQDQGRLFLIPYQIAVTSISRPRGKPRSSRLCVISRTTEIRPCARRAVQSLA